MNVIVKAQLPVASSMEEAPMLVYTEDRSLVHHFIAVTPEWRRLFGRKMKIYLHAELDANGGIRPIAVIEDQPW
jgi:hypothetical protein